MVRTTATVASDAGLTERDDVRVVLGTANLVAAGVPEGQEDGRAARVAAAQPEDKDDVRSAKAKSSNDKHTWRTGEKHVQSHVPARWHTTGAGRVVSPAALFVDLICN